jgi:hypothetical protein
MPTEACVMAWIAAALVSMLSADFVHVMLPGIEHTRTGMGIGAGAVDAIRTAPQSQQLGRSISRTGEADAP